MWLAWTLAGLAGVLLTALVVSGLGLLWNVLDQFGLGAPVAILELLANATLGLCLSLPQFVVLRVVLGQTTGAARAWVPVSTLVFTAEYFADAYWFRGAGPWIAVVVGTLEVVILALAQGLLLADMLRARSAAWLWLLGMTIFSLAVFGLGFLSIQVSDWLSGLILGLLYGGTTGAGLALAVRWSARRRLLPGC